MIDTAVAHLISSSAADLSLSSIQRPSFRAVLREAKDTFLSLWQEPTIHQITNAIIQGAKKLLEAVRGSGNARLLQDDKPTAHPVAAGEG